MACCITCGKPIFVECTSDEPACRKCIDDEINIAARCENKCELVESHTIVDADTLKIFGTPLRYAQWVASNSRLFFNWKRVHRSSARKYRRLRAQIKRSLDKYPELLLDSKQKDISEGVDGCPPIESSPSTIEKLLPPSIRETVLVRNFSFVALYD
jgi:hypothetical protein